MLLGEIDSLSRRTGWCEASREHFAAWLHCDPTNISHYVSKLQKLGFLQVQRVAGRRNKMRVVNARFYDTTPVSHIHGGGEWGSRVGVNGVHGGGEWGSPEIQEKYKNKSVLARAHENEPETFDLEAEKSTPSPIAPAPSPAAPSWRDRPRTDTPAQMSDDLRRFYMAYPDDWKKMLDESGAKYPAAELRGIVTAFCAYQIENNRTANTYRQTHAALQRWLINQKSMKPAQPQPRPIPQTATAANLRVYE